MKSSCRTRRRFRLKRDNDSIDDVAKKPISNKSILKSSTTSSKEDTKRKNLAVSIDMSSIAETQIVDKQTVCVDILTNGFVQSFIDFFYLTHRPSSKERTPEEGVSDDDASDIPIVSSEHMRLLQSKLIQAETAKRRAGQINVVYDSYNTLAKHFQDIGDHKTAVYFFEKCLEIASMSVDVEGEISANHNLGDAYDKAGDFTNAIFFHERTLELARKEGDQSSETRSNRHLARVYVKEAERLDAEGDVENATKLNEKCLETTRQINEFVAIGEAHYRLGCSLVKSGHAENAMPHLQAYVEVIEKTRDETGEANAYSAIASAHEAMGKYDAALDALQQYLTCSKNIKNLSFQAEACFRLGNIYNQKEMYDRAAEFFSQNYEIVRIMISKNQASLDLLHRARMSLGVARGNAMLRKFVAAANDDMSTLLKWKNRRERII